LQWTGVVVGVGADVPGDGGAEGLDGVGGAAEAL
jgi:hypothetical protein